MLKPEPKAKAGIIPPENSKASNRMSVVSSSLPERVYSIAQCRALDDAIIQAGTAGVLLMKSAARAALAVIEERWPAEPLCILCGSGNNAGDGYMMAALAAQRCQTVQVYWLTDPEKLQGDAALAYQFALREGVSIEPLAERNLPDEGLLVDALMGTGAQGALRPAFAELISAINESPLPCLSVDLPSGVNADTGAVLEHAVMADVTITFVGMKLGLLTGAAKDAVGELYFAPLHEDEYSIPHTAEILNLENLLAQWPARVINSHKNSHGHVLVIGGNHGMGGAVHLCAEAAMRTGAGLVSVATRAEHIPSLLARLPSVMARSVENTEDLEALLSKATAVVIGPGLGLDNWGRAMLDTALKAGKPLLIDADALTLIAELTPNLPEDCILTPHPGEAARLMALSNSDVQASRPQICRDMKSRWGGAVLLKGAGSLLALEKGLFVCPYGNPGMAVAGMGDTLAGIVAALWAQGLPRDHALALGVCLHARAADMEAEQQGERGLLPSDLLPWLRALINGR